MELLQLETMSHYGVRTKVQLVRLLTLFQKLLQIIELLPTQIHYLNSVMTEDMEQEMVVLQIVSVKILMETQSLLVVQMEI